jgi:hypothetical protein
MSYRVIGLISLGLAAVVLFWPISLCYPNSAWPEYGNPESCTPEITTAQAIGLGWPEATGSMIFIVALSGLGVYLLAKRGSLSKDSDTQNESD